MKKILISICFILLFSTFSLSSISAKANVTSNIQEPIPGYIDAETESRENLDEQILDINLQINNLNTNAKNLGDPEVSNISSELSTINFEKLVNDQINLFEQEALSMTVDNNLTNNEITPESSIQTEVDGEEIIDVEYDYDINDLPAIELLDTTVSLNIIEEVNTDIYTTNEIPSFNKLLEGKLTPTGTGTGVGSNPITTQPVKPTPVPMSMSLNSLTSTQSQVNAASGGLGWFTTAESTYVINPGTKNAKLVTQVAVFSSGGKIKPKNYTINLTHHTAPSRAGLYSLVRSTNFYNVSLLQTKKIESPITKTYFWKGGSSTKGHFANGQVKTEKFSRVLLLNKKGVKYPSFTDSVSKKVMAEPTSTTWPKIEESKRVKWTTTDRTKYKNWYDQTYKRINWTGIHCHHIKPLLYGGTNSNSNLIPLPEKFHTGTVTPWWKNY